MAEGNASVGRASADEVRRKHDEYLLPATLTYYSSPLVPEEGRGARVRDAEGREYLDFFAGILTVSLGHGHPRVTAAVREQAERLMHISSLYPTRGVVELAERLARIAPGRLSRTCFVASGTEANETAVMLAQVATGRTEIIALRHGYSGRSLLARDLTGHAPWRPTPSQVAAIKHAPAPYCYRCPLGKTFPSCDLACADDVAEVIRTQTTGGIAAFLAEPVAGVGGVIVPPPGYFERVVEIVRGANGLFICDEVQAGFGRTGKMFAIQHFDVEPDIMCMAKGIANGMPLGATIATPEVAASLKSLTISTFGGNPLSVAAAAVVIDVMEEEDVCANARSRGERLMEGLRRLQREHPRLIGDVRGLGLMVGVELVMDESGGDRTPNPAAAGALLDAARDRGLLVGKGGLHGNVIRIGPPLTIDDAEVDEALRILSDVFSLIDS